MDNKINSNAWRENFSVYSENLPVYYILSIVVSFLSVIFTWWYHKSTIRLSMNNEMIQSNNLEDNLNVSFIYFFLQIFKYFWVV